LYPLRLEPENKVVTFISKYFPVILLPLLVLMSVGIFRRYDDYGLTINRAYVFLLNFWLYGISIYLFISKSMHLKWIIISFASIVFISSIGPWSVYGVTRRKMVNEIGLLLEKTHLLKEGKVVDNSKTVFIDDSLGTQLSEKVFYVCQNFGNEAIKKYFKDSIGDKGIGEIQAMLGNFETTLKFGRTFKSVNYFNAILKTENFATEIDSFKTFIRIRKNFNNNIYKSKDLDILYQNNSLVIKKLNLGDSILKIPLTPKLKYIIKTDKPNQTYKLNELTIENESFKLIINNVVGSYIFKKDSISVTTLDANLFLK